MTAKTKEARKGKDKGKTTAAARTLIDAEAHDAEKFKLETFETAGGKTLVKLTRENVAKVEAMIATDSKYSRNMDPNVGPEGKDEVGSEAYCVSRFVEALDGRKNIDEKEFSRRTKDAVSAVNRANSTHLNADKVGVDQISERIVNFGRERIKASLKSSDLDLFNEIARPTEKVKTPRTNTSFASKFCRIVCFFLFKGKEEADKYSAYDTIVREALPFYMEFYGVGNEMTNKQLKDYGVFRKAIDDVREAAAKKNSEEISRRGFDHLLWYFHKGR